MAKTSKARHDNRKVELLVVGNELLNGTTLDTNSHWISKELSNMGYVVERKTTIRDDLLTIKQGFLECLSRRPAWIFALGGLGPTFDDLTLEGLALALKTKLALNQAALRMMKQSYERRRKTLGLKTPKRVSRASLKMAKIPKGATPLENSAGSAPGVLAFFRGTKIISLPGVPNEVKAIFSEKVIPLLNESSTQKRSRAERWFEVLGLSESKLAPKSLKLFKKYSKEIYVKSHPMGFRQGMSLLHIQLLMDYGIEEEKEANELLNKVSDELEAVMKRLGARYVKKITSGASQ